MISRKAYLFLPSFDLITFKIIRLRMPTAIILVLVDKWKSSSCISLANRIIISINKLFIEFSVDDRFHDKLIA